MKKQILGTAPSPAGHWVGDGFPVRTLFSYDGLGRQLSPFLMLDYGGPVEFPPAERPRGVGEHPHRGFETVTIVYQGELAHRDSAGNQGLIGPGDVQWMTAASGVLHDEFHSPGFTRRGGILEMVQLWVNLPAALKMTAPRYQAVLAAQIRDVPLPGGAGFARIIAGNYAGHPGAAKTHTPMNVWDLRLHAGRSALLPVPEGHNTILVCLRGRIQLEGGGAVIGPAEMAVLSGSGDRFTIASDAESVALLLSGQPIEEPVVGMGPFVMNTRAEIDAAVSDFQSGRFGRLPQTAGSAPVH
jgi:redox-sensitive bicupin YhaK (pirin superfamily)